jgi:predicted esterase
MLHQTASTQLMTYRLPNDSLGVFVFHHGNKPQKNVPLVIVVPYALGGDSMVEDWYLWNLDQMEPDNSFADSQGLAVAWIYAGGRNYSAIDTEKEITAVLNRLRSEYAIDEQRIFIMGDCEGGRRALLQLAASPERYAACVVAAPITLLGGTDGIPIDLIPQMGKVPILIKHGTNDHIASVENSRRFVSEAPKYDLPVIYIENEDYHVYINKDSRRFAFEFFGQFNGNR